MLAPQKESIFGCSCRLWLLSWRRARVFARSCSLLSKYLPILWKQRKEQSHAQCHVTHRIRIFDKISEHVKVAKSVDIAVPELAVTLWVILCLSAVWAPHTALCTFVTTRCYAEPKGSDNPLVVSTLCTPTFWEEQSFSVF